VRCFVLWERRFRSSVTLLVLSTHPAQSTHPAHCGLAHTYGASLGPSQRHIGTSASASTAHESAITMDRAARPTASSGYRAGASSNAAALCCSRPWLPAEGGPPRAPPLPASSSAAPASSSSSSSSPSSSSRAPSSHASSSPPPPPPPRPPVPHPPLLPSLPMHGSRWRQCNREPRHSRSEKRVCVLKRTELAAKYQGRRGVWPGKDVWLGRTGSKGSIDVQYS
jgi:hypothetical protein